MKFIIIGCGSIGQRHLRNLKLLGCDVFGYEPDRRRAAQVRKQYNIEVYDNLNDALQNGFHAALICCPTRFHVSLALQAVRKGMHIFIEKPLSDTLKGVNGLQRIVTQKKLVALVGCNTRFFPSFALVKKLIDEKAVGRVLSVRIECGFYLPYWHPREDYRKSYSGNRKLGGGVILDDIHELDALYWLFGKVKEVFCFADKVSDLEIDTEDIAEILLEFKSGVIAQVHLDYLQHTYRRNYEIIGQSGIILWDYISQSVELFSRATNQKRVFQESINTSRETMFTEEMRHFVRCIEGKEKSINDLSSAVEILDIARTCHLSANKREVVHL